ncbi:hypothetical protein T492DRAFT_867891, partial [Pavlovales sp. CCMP2436]
PDERVASALVEGALVALAAASGESATAVRVESGSRTYDFVKGLTAVFDSAPASLAKSAGARSEFGKLFGCATLAALARLPARLQVAEGALAQLRAARLVSGWSWLEAVCPG